MIYKNKINIHHTKKQNNYYSKMFHSDPILLPLKRNDWLFLYLGTFECLSFATTFIILKLDLRA